MTDNGHTVKSFDAELERIKNSVIEMGGIAEAQVEAAIRAVVTRDSELATNVVSHDAEIDRLEGELENLTTRLLALRQPVASDLRVVISALKIASILERIGDYAANVAKRALALNREQSVKPVAMLPRMGELVQHMINDILDAYGRDDADLAMQVWRRDAEVDEIYNSMFRELLTYMMEDPRSITTCTHLLFMAKNVERIGDHTTNIAEIIHFQVHGSMPETERPKGDVTSYTVVSPEGAENVNEE